MIKMISFEISLDMYYEFVQLKTSTRSLKYLVSANYVG